MWTSTRKGDRFCPWIAIPAGWGPPFFPLLHLSLQISSWRAGWLHPTAPHLCLSPRAQKKAFPAHLSESVSLCSCQQEVNFRVRFSVERVRSGTDNVAWVLVHCARSTRSLCSSVYESQFWRKAFLMSAVMWVCVAPGSPADDQKCLVSVALSRQGYGLSTTGVDKHFSMWGLEGTRHRSRTQSLWYAPASS